LLSPTAHRIETLATDSNPHLSRLRYSVLRLFDEKKDEKSLDFGWAKLMISPMFWPA